MQDDLDSDSWGGQNVFDVYTNSKARDWMARAIRIGKIRIVSSATPSGKCKRTI